MSIQKHVRQINIKQRTQPKADKHGADNMNNSKSWLPKIYQGAYDRSTRYIQYDHMDFDVDVNMALDTTAEFCTLLDEYTKLPFRLDATSKMTTNDIDIINIMLRKWCSINEWESRIFDLFRNSIKYGDQVMIRDPETYILYWVDISNVTGIVADEESGNKPEYYFIKDLSLNVMNKVATDNSEYFVNSPLAGTIRQARSISSGSYLDTTNNDQYPVEATHIVHCSTSNGMDALWPFGRSVLDDIFKSFKQKELLEDAIIIYRVQRSPERLVFKVDTGDMNPKKAQIYLDQFAKNIRQKRTPVIDRSKGVTEMDTVYNPMSITEDFFFSNSLEGRGTSVESLPGGECLAMNTKIRLLDGRTMTINEIKERYDNGEQLWTYTIDKTTGVVCPGMISWAGVTREDAEVTRLDFSDGSYIICTPDHKFPMKESKIYKEAKDIQVGEKFYNINEKYSNNTVWYFDKQHGDWRKTSEMFDEFFKYEDFKLKHRMIVDEHSFETEDYVDEITLVSKTTLPNMDTGTITIDGSEFYTDNHTFPLENGVFTKNSTGTIDDLKFFTTRLMRGLRVPPSYMNWLSEDGQGYTYNDGKLGSAYMEEFKFNQYCMRLQRSIIKNLNKEFKLFLKKNKVNVDYGEFNIAFVKPQDFAEYRQIELDTAQLAVFQSVQETPYLSKRFVMKRFMGLSDAEIKENERLWKEEQGIKFTLGKNEPDLNDVDVPEPSSEDIDEIENTESSEEEPEDNTNDDSGLEDFSFDEE